MNSCNLIFQSHKNPPLTGLKWNISSNQYGWVVKIKPKTINHSLKKPTVERFKNAWLGCNRFVLFQLQGDTTPGRWHTKLATVDIYGNSAYCVSLTFLIYVQKGFEAAV